MKVLAFLTSLILSISSSAAPSEITLLLFDAVYQNSLDKVVALIEQGADVNAQESENGATPLIYGLTLTNAFDIKIVEALIDAGADLDIQVFNDADPYLYAGGETALHVAARRRRFDVVDLLVAEGADTSLETSTGWTAYEMSRTWARTSKTIEIAFDPEVRLPAEPE